MPRTAWTSPKALVTPESETAGTLVVASVLESWLVVMPPAFCLRASWPSLERHEVGMTNVRSPRGFRDRRLARLPQPPGSSACWQVDERARERAPARAGWRGTRTSTARKSRTARSSASCAAESGPESIRGGRRQSSDAASLGGVSSRLPCGRHARREAEATARRRRRSGSASTRRGRCEVGGHHRGADRRMGIEHPGALSPPASGSTRIGVRGICQVGRGRGRGPARRAVQQGRTTAGDSLPRWSMSAAEHRRLLLEILRDVDAGAYSVLERHYLIGSSDLTASGIASEPRHQGSAGLPDATTST